MLGPTGVPTSLYGQLAKMKPRLECYLREPTTFALENYIHGYQAALYNHQMVEDGPPYQVFLYWLDHKYPGRCWANGWARVLLKQCGTHEAAIARFYELIEHYAAMKPRMVGLLHLGDDQRAAIVKPEPHMRKWVPQRIEVWEVAPKGWAFYCEWFDGYPEETGVYSTPEKAASRVCWEYGIALEEILPGELGSEL